MINHILEESVVGLVGFVEDTTAHVGTEGDEDKVVEQRESLDLEWLKVLHDLHAQEDNNQVGRRDQKDVERVHQRQLAGKRGLDRDKEASEVLDSFREELFQLSRDGFLERVDIGGCEDTKGPSQVNKIVLRQLEGEFRRHG
jgi:hypothetical protein